MPQIITPDVAWLERMENFYAELMDEMRGQPYCPHWEKGAYPGRDYLKDSLERKELYVALVSEKPASAMILNHACNPAYANVAWKSVPEGRGVLYLHVLAVHPTYGRQGLGRAMVRHALETAARGGYAAVRLDVRQGTLPAQKLYESCGFRHAGTMPMYYEPEGWADFMAYEHTLENIARAAE